MFTHRSAALVLALAIAGIAVCATAVRAQDSRYFVRIDAGTFSMGAVRESDSVASHDESPVHAVTLAAFDIGRYEVTVREFAQFVDAGGYSNEEFRRLWDLTQHGEGNRFGSWNSPENWGEQLLFPNRPVTGVTWHEAMAFCRWVSRRVGQRITLPTEAQWERAARGTESRRFPWGEQIPDGTLDLNYDRKIGHTSDVGSHPAGNTPGEHPISDLAGNAWEWCLDRKVSYGFHAPRAGDGLRDGRSQYRVVRGGSFHHDGKELRSARRNGAGADVRCELIGFRIVRAVGG